MNCNFVFVRHGYGCHNAIGDLYDAKQIDESDVQDFLQMRKDPELTPTGIDASVFNGCLIGRILHNLPLLTQKKSFTMEPIHLVACSPLIRSMETAYFMTRKWKNPPQKIFVMPYLRELDESSDNPESEESQERIDTIPSYAMKTIDEQKYHLAKHGILDYFDFTFVEELPELRKTPGNITRFLKWFAQEIYPLTGLKSINGFIVTHAGVLKQFESKGFRNNSGIVVNTTISKNNHVFINKTIRLEDYISSSFFRDYESFANKEYYCPSDRCGSLCKNNMDGQRKNLPLKDCEYSNFKTKSNPTINPTS